MDVPTLQMAKVRDLPTRKYLCVEYPGYVRDIEKVLETLGGIESIQLAHLRGQKQLAVMFRPRDSFAHSVFCDRTHTTNMLLEIRQSLNEEGERKVEGKIIGLVLHTYRCRGMADFQYLPRQLEEPSTEPSADQGIFASDGANVVMHVPPPIFSKSDIPKNYQFEPNPNYKVVERKDENGMLQRAFIARKTRQVSDGSLQIIDFDHEGVPTSALSSVPDANEELVAKLEVMFESHRVWGRPALENSIPPHLLGYLNPSLHRVAYTFSNGPWRHTWLKLGYDPRLHPESRRYQVIDFRVSGEFVRGTPSSWERVPTERPRRVNSSKKSVNEVLSNQRYSGSEWKSVQIIKEAEYRYLKPPERRQTIYVLNDIELEGLEEQLSKKPSEECKRETGWLRPETLREIRRLMNDHLRTLVVKWDSGEMMEELMARDQDDDREMMEGLMARDQDDDQQDDTPLVLKEKEQKEEGTYNFLRNILETIQVSQGGAVQMDSGSMPTLTSMIEGETAYDLLGDSDENEEIF